MASFKRSRLSFGGEGARAERRQSLRIPAQCQVGDRPPEDVSITAIDREGCSLWPVAVGVTKSQPVTLYLKGEAPVAGELRWIRQGSLGVAFTAPLDEAVVERLRVIEAPSNVITLRKNSAR